jgi:hypothetical protein
MFRALLAHLQEDKLYCHSSGTVTLCKRLYSEPGCWAWLQQLSRYHWRTPWNSNILSAGYTCACRSNGSLLTDGTFASWRQTTHRPLILMDTQKNYFFLKIVHEFGLTLWHFFRTAVFHGGSEWKFYAEIIMNKIKIEITNIRVGRDSSVGTATRYWLDGPWMNAGGGEIFRTRPDRPWGPHTYPPMRCVLGHCGGKAAWAWRNHPSHLAW